MQDICQLESRSLRILFNSRSVFHNLYVGEQVGPGKAEEQIKMSVFDTMSYDFQGKREGRLP